ncbi:DUF3006 family protein [Sporosarcina psychrophila]|uniref:DUF3006 family protein n=1 Tax=Sporosarcina psychrophila TaxID=1476 RepID=UPI0030CF0469
MPVNKVKYTLDKVEDNIYVFLEYPDEENQLMVPVNKYSGELSEGDIVWIRKIDSEFMIELLDEETEDMRDKVSKLLEKLKNKK